MNKSFELLFLFTIFLCCPLLIFAQNNADLDWQEYQNKKANIKFLIPSQFSVYEITDNPQPCDFSITFSFETYSDPHHNGKRTEFESWITLNLSKENYDNANTENRFFLKDSQWMAESPLGTSLTVEADSVISKSSDWFGVETNITTAYYYKEGGKVTAGGTGYSFFAIKTLQNKCHATLLFDNLAATEDKVGQQVISTLQRIK